MSSAKKQVEEGWPIREDGRRMIFYVFQGALFKKESRGGYIWAPISNKDGKKFFHWDNLLNVREGDIILHGSNGKLAAVSIAKGPCYECPQPEELRTEALWEGNGRRVDCDYIILERPIKTSDYKNTILRCCNKKFSPFNRLGAGNTGYLFEIDRDLAQLFVSESAKANPVLLEKEPFKSLIDYHYPILQNYVYKKDVDIDMVDERMYNYSDVFDPIYFAIGEPEADGGQAYTENWHLHIHGLDIDVYPGEFQRGDDYNPEELFELKAVKKPGMKRNEYYTWLAEASFSDAVFAYIQGLKNEKHSYPGTCDIIIDEACFFYPDAADFDFDDDDEDEEDFESNYHPVLSSWQDHQDDKTWVEKKHEPIAVPADSKIYQYAVERLKAGMAAFAERNQDIREIKEYFSNFNDHLAAFEKGTPIEEGLCLFFSLSKSEDGEDSDDPISVVYATLENDTFSLEACTGRSLYDFDFMGPDLLYSVCLNGYEDGWPTGYEDYDWVQQFFNESNLVLHLKYSGEDKGFTYTAHNHKGIFDDNKSILSNPWPF